jgi:hypothetical protein
LEVRTQAADKEQFERQRSTIQAALNSISGTKFTPAGDPKFYDPNAGVSNNDLGLGPNQASERLDRTGGNCACPCR